MGRCADGFQWVEPKLHKLLISMGFSSEAARLALQQSNNNVSHSVQLIQEQPNLLNVASTSKFKVKKDVLQQVFSAACHEREYKYNETSFFSPHILNFFPVLCTFPLIPAGCS